MLFDRILGRKVLRDKYNFPIAIKRNFKKDDLSEQVRKLLIEEDQKLILMVRG